MHNAHDLLEHVLILCINLSHFLVALVDSSSTHVIEIFGQAGINVALQIDELVDQVFPFLGLHQHRCRIAR